MPNDTDDLNSQRYTPGAEKMLKQFLTLESVNANSKAFRENYGAAIQGSVALDPPVKCPHCEYVAKTVAEVRFHTRSCGHEMAL